MKLCGSLLMAALATTVSWAQTRPPYPPSPVISRVAFAPASSIVRAAVGSDNYPWNTSTPELDAWLPSQVRAYRAGYGTVLPLPTRDTVRLPSAGYGDNDDASGFEVGLEELLAQPEGWLVWVAHGLDGEGWGPMSADYLKRLLDRLLSLGVEVLPAGVVLAQAT